MRSKELRRDGRKPAQQKGESLDPTGGGNGRVQHAGGVHLAIRPPFGRDSPQLSRPQRSVKYEGHFQNKEK